MKQKFKIPVILLLLTLFSTQLLSEKINDKNLQIFPLIEKNENTQVYIYVFTNINSCAICSTYVDQLYFELEKTYKCEIYMFINGISYNDIESIRTLYPDEYKIFPDNNNFYSNIYQISTFPFYLVLNNKGEVIAQGEPARSINIEDLISKLDLTTAYNNDNIQDEHEKLKLTKSIELKQSESWIVAENRLTLYREKTGEVIILTPKTNTLKIFDSLGIQTKTIDLLTKYKNKPLATFSTVWYIQDTSILGINQQFYNNRELFILNLINDSLSIIPFDYTYLKQNKLSIFIRPSYCNQSNLLLLQLRYIDNTKLANTDKTFVLYDFEKAQFQQFGIPDTISQKYSVSDIQHSIYYYNCQNIYEIQGLTKNIRKYNRNGDILSTRPIDFGSNYKTNIDYDYIPGKTDVNKLYKNVSFLENLHIDENLELLFVLYYNLIVDNKQYTLDIPKIEYYLHISHLDGTSYLADDIKIPDNGIPFYMDNNKFGITKLLGNKMYIEWYDYSNYKN